MNKYIIINKNGYYYRGRTQDNKSYPIFCSDITLAKVYTNELEALAESELIGQVEVKSFKKRKDN